jgi:hypothetical protein
MKLNGRVKQITQMPSPHEKYASKTAFGKLPIDVDSPIRFCRLVKKYQPKRQINLSFSNARLPVVETNQIKIQNALPPPRKHLDKMNVFIVLPSAKFYQMCGSQPHRFHRNKNK